MEAVSVSKAAEKVGLGNPLILMEIIYHFRYLGVIANLLCKTIWIPCVILLCTFLEFVGFLQKKNVHK